MKLVIGSPKAILKEEIQMRWDETRWILHHKSTPRHMAMAVQQFLGGKQITLMPQPVYSPHLTSGDFWLIPGLKMGILGKCFDTSRHQIKSDSQPVHHTKGGIPRASPSMAKLLQQVYVCRRNVLQGCLDWKTLCFKYWRCMA
jgi:hypothetical protein